mmetsp:Transcript_8978/g.27217  ORF Transcript_8978/g.27217 Transcript_8978/m.27217 type:complete len:375 (-) Transcript_8978:718-1842(-)
MHEGGRQALLGGEAVRPGRGLVCLRVPQGRPGSGRAALNLQARPYGPRDLCCGNTPRLGFFGADQRVPGPLRGDVRVQDSVPGEPIGQWPDHEEGASEERPRGGALRPGPAGGRQPGQELLQLRALLRDLLQVLGAGPGPRLLDREGRPAKVRPARAHLVRRGQDLCRVPAKVQVPSPGDDVLRGFRVVHFERGGQDDRAQPVVLVQVPRPRLQRRPRRPRAGALLQRAGAQDCVPEPGARGLCGYHDPAHRHAFARAARPDHPARPEEAAEAGEQLAERALQPQEVLQLRDEGPEGQEGGGADRLGKVCHGGIREARDGGGARRGLGGRKGLRGRERDPGAGGGAGRGVMVNSLSTLSLCVLHGPNFNPFDPS